MAETVNQESYGLVLGGGGLRGAYEVGVWQALIELDIPIGGISGTSIGALNGAFMLQGEWERLNQVYHELEISQMIELKCALDPERDIFSGQNLRLVVREMIQQRGFDNQPLRRLIEENLDVAAVYASPLTFGIVTYNLKNMRPDELYKEDIEPELFIDYLLASACFPIFKNQKIKENRYTDGFLYDNMPINLLLRKGFQKIIAVDVHGYGLVKPPGKHDAYIKLLSPEENLGGIFEFNRKRISRNIRLGYLDTLRSYSRLQGHVYYFPTEEFSRLLHDFALRTIYGLEYAAQIYRLPKTRIYTAAEFLSHLTAAHLAARSRYAELKLNFEDIIRNRKMIVSLVKKDLGICLFEEWFSARPQAPHSWLARAFQSYTLAAQAMLEYDNMCGG